VRVAVGEVGIQADGLEQLLHALVALVLGHQVVDLKRLTDDVPDGHAGIERRIWVLENHLEVTPHAAHVATIEFGQVGATEVDFARGRLIELENGATGRTLAAARFTHQTQRFTLAHAERDAINRFDGADLTLKDDPLGEREVHLEVFDLQDRWAQDFPGDAHRSIFGLGGRSGNNWGGHR